MSPVRAERGGWGEEKLSGAKEEVVALTQRKVDVERQLKEKREEADRLQLSAIAAQEKAFRTSEAWLAEWKTMYVLEMGDPAASASAALADGDVTVAEVALRRVREACQQIVILETENKALKLQVA